MMQDRQVGADTLSAKGTKKTKAGKARPTASQLRYLKSGLDQPGGKLPLFDQFGQAISRNTIRSCIEHGWAERWFENPTKPDWLVCRITEEGRIAAKNG